jgi:hypothetical protein
MTEGRITERGGHHGGEMVGEDGDGGINLESTTVPTDQASTFHSHSPAPSASDPHPNTSSASQKSSPKHRTQTHLVPSRVQTRKPRSSIQQHPRPRKEACATPCGLLFSSIQTSSLTTADNSASEKSIMNESGERRRPLFLTSGITLHPSQTLSQRRERDGSGACRIHGAKGV